MSSNVFWRCTGHGTWDHNIPGIGKLWQPTLMQEAPTLFIVTFGPMSNFPDHSGTHSPWHWQPCGPHECPLKWDSREERDISWQSLDLCRLVCKVYQNTKNSSVFTLGAGGAFQLLPCSLGLLVFLSDPVWSHWYQSAGRLQTPPSSNSPPGLAPGQNGAVNRPVIVQIFPAWSKFYMNISYRQFSVESSNLVKSALPRSCHLGWPPEITEIASVFPTQDGWFIRSLIFSSPVFTAGSSILCCWHFNPDEF